MRTDFCPGEKQAKNILPQRGRDRKAAIHHIHQLSTGTSPPSFTSLITMFCLRYSIYSEGPHRRHFPQLTTLHTLVKRTTLTTTAHHCRHPSTTFSSFTATRESIIRINLSTTAEAAARRCHQPLRRRCGRMASTVPRLLVARRQQALHRVSAASLEQVDHHGRREDADRAAADARRGVLIRDHRAKLRPSARRGLQKDRLPWAHVSGCIIPRCRHRASSSSAAASAGFWAAQALQARAGRR